MALNKKISKKDEYKEKKLDNVLLSPRQRAMQEGRKKRKEYLMNKARKK